MTDIIHKKRIHLILTIFGLLFLMLLPGVVNADTGVITGTVVNVRSGPGASNSIIGTLSQDTQVDILGSSGQWFKIKYSNLTGWVSSTLMTVKQKDIKVIVKEDLVNLRSGPNTTYSLIGQAAKGDVLTLVDVEGQWYKIKTASGQIAYILSELADNAEEAVPAMAAPPMQTDATIPASKLAAPKVIFDGKEMQFEISPIIENNRTMVPLRAIFEAMGAAVEWNNTTRTVKASKGDTSVILTLESLAPTINGKVYPLDTAARIVGNRTLAPLRFVGEAFGGTVKWDNDSRTITINSADSPQVKEVTVNDTEVNLRSGPASTFSKIDSVRSGERLSVIDQKDGWYQVSRGGGRTAWIAGWLVKTNTAGEQQTDPVIPETPVVDKPKPPTVETNTPVDTDDLNTRGDEGSTVDAGYISLSTSLAPEGYRLAMKSNNKIDASISEQNNGQKIIYTFKGVKLKSGHDEAAFYIGTGPNSRVAITAETVANTTWITIDMPYAYHYLSSKEENDSKQVFLIPSQITRVNEIQLKNGNQVIAIHSTSAMQYKEEYKDNVLNITLPGTYRGQSQDTYILEGTIGRQVKVEKGSADDTTLLKIVLNKELDTYQLTRNTSGDTLSIILVSKNKKPEPVQETKKITLVLDPGHGGRDPGSRRTLNEKDITLSIALKAKAILEKETNLKVVMTRTTDIELGPDEKSDLQARADIANKLPADLFIAMHCNAFGSTDPHGTETYYYAPATNQALYAQEYQRSVLADLLQKGLVNKLGRTNRGVKQNNYAVLRETNMPSALIETAFISNPEEEALLGQDSFQQKAAEAIADAVKRYITLML